MRGWLPFVMMAAGCGFEHGSSSVDATLDVTLDAPGDTDGDGVLDDVDNCPMVANPDQRDYDGDGRGDACDKCPHLASATDPDSDGDGIGDACDPQPTIGTDRLVLWDGFYDAASVATWAQGGVGSTWAVTGGALHQDSPGAGDHVFGPSMPFQHISVATSFQIVALGSIPQIGVCSGFVPATQLYCCTIRDTGPQLIAGSAYAGNSDSQVTPWTGTFGIGDRIQIVQNTAGTNQCDASQGTTNVVRGAILGPTGGLLQLYTTSAGVAFDYVFVVELGS